MAKKKKVTEVVKELPYPYNVGVKPAVEYVEVNENTQPTSTEEKKEVTDAMSKAQELMDNAVNEVLDGIISKKELLNIAIRKVRATSVLSVEEDDALGKMHIEVKVWF